MKKCFECTESPTWVVWCKDIKNTKVIHVRFSCDVHLSKACDYFHGDPLKCQYMNVCSVAHFQISTEYQYSTMELYGFPVLFPKGILDASKIKRDDYFVKFRPFNDIGKMN